MKLLTAIVLATSALALGVPPVDKSTKSAVSANPQDVQQASSLAGPEVDAQMGGESLSRTRKNKRQKKPCLPRKPKTAQGLLPKDSDKMALGGDGSAGSKAGSRGDQNAETSTEKSGLTANGESPDPDAGATKPEAGATKPDGANAGSGVDQGGESSPEKSDSTTNNASTEGTTSSPASLLPDNGNKKPTESDGTSPTKTQGDGQKKPVEDDASTSSTPTKTHSKGDKKPLGEDDTATSPKKMQGNDDETADNNTTTTTTPTKPRGKGNSKHKVAVYWGQHGGGIPEKPLADYCKPDSGIDILLLAFLYQWGNGHTVPGGAIGNECTIEEKTGKPTNCRNLAKDISTCQKAGVQIFLSLGGAVGTYSLKSKAEGESFAQNIWAAYGGGKSSVVRPFGSVQFDGFDFNIENSAGLGYYQFAVTKLRGLIAKGGKDVKISSAPQCPIPEPNLDKEIQAAKFDILWVQFYNNPGCSLDTGTNFDAWSEHIAKGASAGAEIYVGAPAGPKAANGADSGAKFYLEPAKLAKVVAKVKSIKGFGGIMMWAAGFSDANQVGGKTYAQQAKCILGTGKEC